MIWQIFKNPGYHSLIPTGERVHDIRASFHYARELMEAEDAAGHQRAIGILRKLLPLQDRDPVSATYGLWSWHLEEPLEKMDRPDWNWADFCGLALIALLNTSAPRLPEDVRTAARDAVHHAAGSIYRRNMGPHYTNISIMGGIVCSLAGELLGESRMLEYGVRRLRQAVEYFGAQGGFNEYNSPTYTRVVLLDCEEALRFLKSPYARESVRFLYEKAWETLARHYHPATGQWAGPHSRDYHTFMRAEMWAWLRTRTGIAAPLHPLAESKEFVGASHAVAEGVACPPRLLERFIALPSAEYTFSETFHRGKTRDVVGTTWMHQEACLGSVNEEFFWDQRRVLLGFWNGAAGSAVALRLRFLHDGQEFTSAYVRNVQDGPRVLSAVHLLLGRGDIHPEWGNPGNDEFRAHDFRLRYELRGLDVQADELSPGTFALRSGRWQAVIRPAPGRFGEAAAEWRIERHQDWVALDAVCYQGTSRAFPFRELRPVILAASLQVQRVGEEEERPAAPTEIRHSITEGKLTAVAGDLSVTVPDHSVPIP
ncbi:hypothetical protein DB346_09375 [Verrucomicrobia bacterium LW23]|nr:hypothetical protein DB346_09375 [Verrucomicrobia bacterium LW23]